MPINIVPVEDIPHLEPIGGFADDLPATLTEQFDRQATLPAHSKVGTRRRRSSGFPIPAIALSPRERDVLLLICRGLSNKDIARELQIAPETVKSHAKRILLKLSARTRAEAVARAVGLNSLSSRLQCTCAGP
jgi:DNA-binding NarL/FixJ family response regulator